MDADAPGSRRGRRLGAVVFFGSVMACGGLVLYIALPAKGNGAAVSVRPDAREWWRPITDGIAIQPGRWRMIVVHHSATASGNAAQFDDYHRYTRQWEGGLGYHFVIGSGQGSPDGVIEIGHRWIHQETGAHVKDHNVGAIGICLVGNFEETRPTPPQMHALVALVRCLMDRCDIVPADVRLHRDLGATACPGRFFPEAEFRAALAAAPATE